MLVVCESTITVAKQTVLLAASTLQSAPCEPKAAASAAPAMKGESTTSRRRSGRNGTRAPRTATAIKAASAANHKGREAGVRVVTSTRAMAAATLVAGEKPGALLVPCVFKCGRTFGSCFPGRRGG